MAFGKDKDKGKPLTENEKNELRQDATARAGDEYQHRAYGQRDDGTLGELTPEEYEKRLEDPLNAANHQAAKPLSDEDAQRMVDGTHFGTKVSTEGEEHISKREAYLDDAMTDEEDRPITTMADQGIDIPLSEAEKHELARTSLEDEPPEPPEPYIDLGCTPWELRPHEFRVCSNTGLSVMRVPGGWIYGDTFVPYIPQTSDAGIWK